jgi:DNA-binding NtrC family response regulator
MVLGLLAVDPTTLTMPVIVASAHPFMRPELAGLLREPQYVFVQKPFPLDTLLQTIAALLTPTTPSDPDRAA